MIYGIGIDCVKTVRMEKSMQKPLFLQRVFSQEEQALLAGKGKQAAASAAACFAAKEAFLKACGKGLGGFPFCEMAALRAENGAPYMALSGAAAAFCHQHGLRCHLSLSHEAGLAFAHVILEEA